MKPLSIAVHSLTAVSLLALGSACTSDTNPFDVTTATTQSPNAKIQLQLNVAATRADLSTTAEKKVTSVTVYVFNDEGKLEYFQTLEVSGDSTQPMEVTSGLKTVYAVAGKTISNPSTAIAKEMTLAAFEDVVFDSKVADLTASTGYMMIGKSQQMIYASAMNNVPIELERLVAKAQVKLGAVKTEDFGFTHGNANFYVAQTCNSMRLQPNGSDVTSFNTHTDGTYVGYNRLPSDQAISGITGDFQADGCGYLTENIVSNPVAGNTSFVILEIPLTPQYDYTCGYDGKLASGKNTNTNGYTFFAVGLIDAENGHEDFAIDIENKRVITFNTKADADRYAAALNGGTAAAVTVSEVDSPMKAPSMKAPEIRQFEVVTFTNKMAYYRINIKDEEDNPRVDRNTFYKITVNSIKSLGCHSKELLYPTNPEADSSVATSAMLGVKFKVAEWDEVDQGVDLD